MTQRQRILSVYRRETPDVVPFMLDLAHWFYHRHHLPWDLSKTHNKPETALIDYHKQHGVGYYMPNLGSFYDVRYGYDVIAEVVKDYLPNGPQITWRYTTPLGSIARRRIWDEQSYSWPVNAWGIKMERDLRVLSYALGSRTFHPRWDHYTAWKDYVAEDGVVYLNAGYSAIGQLMHYWMGAERVLQAAQDWPETLHDVVNRINENNLQLIDLLSESPAEVVILGDNFSSDLQPPQFFAEWSRPYYREAIRRLHMTNKHVAIHIDGKLHGSLRMFREIGANCADAVTPKPLGDLTPRECRMEAGPNFILSGGVSPDLWHASASLDDFKRAVCDWLELKHISPRLIASAGDRIPPGADENRIAIMRDLVEEYGRY